MVSTSGSSGMPLQFTVSGGKADGKRQKAFTAENGEIAKIFRFLDFSAYSARSAEKEFS
jgi:hypothetical protein